MKIRLCFVDNFSSKINIFYFHCLIILFVVFISEVRYLQVVWGLRDGYESAISPTHYFATFYTIGRGKTILPNIDLINKNDLLIRKTNLNHRLYQ